MALMFTAVLQNQSLKKELLVKLLKILLSGYFTLSLYSLSILIRIENIEDSGVNIEKIVVNARDGGWV